MLVNNITKAKTIFPKTETLLLQLNDRARLSFGPVEVTINYFNFLPFTVSVVERNGFRHSVRGVHGENATQCDFIIRVRYFLRADGLDDVRRIINKLSVGADDELQIIRGKFVGDGKFSARTCNGYEILLETRYTQEQFARENGELYCAKRDLVISAKSLEDASAHPHNSDSVDGDELLVSTYSELNPHDYAIKTEIIDNLNEIGPKYGYSLGKVIKITPKKDPKRLNGVYITSIEKNGLSISGFKLNTIKYEPDEVQEKFGLYSRKDEAETGGDVAGSRKLELENKIHELALLKREYDQNSLKTKIEMDEVDHARKIESIQWEERLKTLQRENEHLTHLRDIERSDRKDFYERNSQVRKDTVDIMKFLPQLVIGIGAIILAYNKFIPASSK